MKNLLSIGNVTLKCPDNFQSVSVSGLAESVLAFPEVKKIQLDFVKLDHESFKALYSYSVPQTEIKCTGKNLCAFENGKSLNIDVFARIDIEGGKELEGDSYSGNITIYPSESLLMRDI